MLMRQNVNNDISKDLPIQDVHTISERFKCSHGKSSLKKNQYSVLSKILKPQSHSS